MVGSRGAEGANCQRTGLSWDRMGTSEVARPVHRSSDAGDWVDSNEYG